MSVGNILAEVVEVLPESLSLDRLGLAEVREALAPVIDTILEVRDEVADHLRANDAAAWLNRAIETLEPIKDDLELGRLVHAALVGLRAGVEWLDGERDLKVFDVVVDLVSFGIQVEDYIARGHFLGDLQVAGERIVAASMQAANRGGR